MSGVIFPGVPCKGPTARYRAGRVAWRLPGRVHLDRPFAVRKLAGAEQFGYRPFQHGEPGEVHRARHLRGEHDAPLCRAASDGVTCGVDSLDVEGANFTATPYCETVITRSLFMADDLSYRSVGSVDQADLEMPDSFGFTALGSGSGFGSLSFGSRSLAGIGTTAELGYVNSIGKDLMANGLFNIGEDVRWTSFAKTFDVVG